MTGRWAVGEDAEELLNMDNEDEEEVSTATLFIFVIFSPSESVSCPVSILLISRGNPPPPKKKILSPSLPVFREHAVMMFTSCPFQKYPMTFQKRVITFLPSRLLIWQRHVDSTVHTLKPG